QRQARDHDRAVFPHRGAQGAGAEHTSATAGGWEGNHDESFRLGPPDTDLHIERRNANAWNFTEGRGSAEGPLWRCLAGNVPRVSEALERSGRKRDEAQREEDRGCVRASYGEPAHRPSCWGCSRGLSVSGRPPPPWRPRFPISSRPSLPAYSRRRPPYG